MYILKTQKNIYLNFNNKFYNKKILFFYINKIFSNFNKKFYVNLVILNNIEMLNLNSIYNNKKNITDILSFSYLNKNIIIGDIYICKNLVYFKSIFYCISLDNMKIILITHGCLHLLSFNHNKYYDFNKMRIMENFYLHLFKKFFQQM